MNILKTFIILLLIIPISFCSSQKEIETEGSLEVLMGFGGMNSETGSLQFAVIYNLISPDGKYQLEFDKDCVKKGVQEGVILSSGGKYRVKGKLKEPQQNTNLDSKVLLVSYFECIEPGKSNKSKVGF